MKNSSRKHSSIFRPRGFITLLKMLFNSTPCRPGPTAASCSTAVPIYFHAQFSFVCISFFDENFLKEMVRLTDGRHCLKLNYTAGCPCQRGFKIDQFGRLLGGKKKHTTTKKSQLIRFLILWWLTSKSIILTAGSISPWHGFLLHRLSEDLTPIHSIPVSKAAHEAFDS